MMEAVGYCRFDASPLPGKSLNNAQRANSLKSRCFLIGIAAYCEVATSDMERSR